MTLPTQLSVSKNKKLECARPVFLDAQSNQRPVYLANIYSRRHIMLTLLQLSQDGSTARQLEPLMPHASFVCSVYINNM